MSEAQAKVAQVLRFLREFEQIRNKPARHVQQHLDHHFARDFPVGPGCRLRVAEFARDDDDETEDHGTLLDVPLLIVDKQHLTPAPEPPAALAGWLEESGKDPAVPPRARSTRSAAGTLIGSRGNGQFESDPERVRAFDEWRRGWETWAEAELPRRRVQA
ncbi:MAG: hypothetical protein HY682_08185, partial [Chloroflexi bacterium]|nr:hypothetical protein [Chloroflexota bacterium]